MPISNRDWRLARLTRTQSGNIADACGSSSTIDWSINEIDQSVQPTTTQRDALKRSFDEAATDLEAHCPTTIPPTALSRLDTIQARLDSTWRATLSIQVALANFRGRAQRCTESPLRYHEFRCAMTC